MSVKPADREAAERALLDPSPLTIMMGVFASVLGVSIVLGHREAWSGPEYSTALQVPGAPESWGWVLAALGVLVVAGKTALKRHRVVLLVGLAGCGFWFTSFSIAFFGAPFATDGAGISQALTYLFLALTYFYRFAIYRRPPIGLS